MDALASLDEALKGNSDAQGHTVAYMIASSTCVLAAACGGGDRHGRLARHPWNMVNDMVNFIWVCDVSHWGGYIGRRESIGFDDSKQ